MIVMQGDEKSHGAGDEGPENANKAAGMTTNADLVAKLVNKPLHVEVLGMGLPLFIIVFQSWKKYMLLPVLHDISAFAKCVQLVFQNVFYISIFCQL